MTNTTQQLRTISAIFEGQPVSDGDGVKLKRIIGTHALKHLDPFLMLDEFRSDSPQDYIGGFPDHPHRGFQTVSYLLEGRIRHQDSQGNSGLIRSGGVQWMNAGRGVIHSEMPEQENGLLWGFQLWVNLPATQKMSEPAYQEFTPEEIPLTSPSEGVTVKVISGQTDEGTLGAVKNIESQPLFLDVRLDANRRFEQAIPSEHTVFVYVYKGSGDIAGTALEAGQLAVLENGDTFEGGSRESDFCFLLIAGKPIREPIVQHGPFVMNTPVEIQQAILDYKTGRFA